MERPVPTWRWSGTRFFLAVTALALAWLLVKLLLSLDGNAETPEAKPPADTRRADGKLPGTPLESPAGTDDSWNIRLGQFRLVNAPTPWVNRYLWSCGVRTCW